MQPSSIRIRTQNILSLFSQIYCWICSDPAVHTRTNPSPAIVFDGLQEFIEEWYTSLNALDISDAKKEAIVDEANKVFSLNILILEELDGNALLVVMKLGLEALKERIGLA